MKSTYSRRRFIAAAAAFTGGASVRACLAEAVKPKPAFQVTIGLQSYSFGLPDLHATIEQAAQLGFRGIEISRRHLSHEANSADIARIKRELDDAGLELTAHGVNAFTSDHEENRKVFEFAQALGVVNVSANPTRDAFDSLDKLVEEYGIRVAIHNHGPMASYDKVVDTLDAIRDHHANIGACADLGHYLRSGEDPVVAIRLLGGRLYGVHLKDYAKHAAATRESVVLGRGLLDLGGVFRALRQVGFPADGAVSIEYETDSATRVQDVMDCLTAAKSSAAKLSG